MNYRMEIAYDGARYKGWQRLGNNPNTVQEKLKQYYRKFCRQKSRDSRFR